MEHIIGLCERCKGYVVVPESWAGPGSPRAVCQGCGAVAVERMPVLKMERPTKDAWVGCLKRQLALIDQGKG